MLVRDFSPKVTAPPATKTSPALIWALILPFICCFWGGPIIGMVLAVRENNLVKAGKSASSPGLVTAAIVLNAFGLVVSVLGVFGSFIGSK
ncbi:MAG: hypothetical protein QM765_00165 [Myxococcales bacterium]